MIGCARFGRARTARFARTRTGWAQTGCVRSGCVAVLLFAVAGCAGSAGGTGARPATGSVPVGSPPVSSAPAGSASPVTTVTPPDAGCGRLHAAVVAVEPNQTYIVGTHAEFAPKNGQFLRVRVSVSNDDPTFHTVHTLASVLVDTAGARHPPSPEAMLIKRQPADVVLGGHDEAQFELWYDLAPATRPAAVALRQDDACVRHIPVPTR